MDLLGQFLTGGLRASTPGPTDDFWYGPVGSGVMTASGQRVDEESARKLSAWFRGRSLLATILAMLPLEVYRRLPDDGGAEAAKAHPLRDLLHDQPNSWQDSFQWRRQKMYHLIDHGNGYDTIVPGRRGFADQLVPIHPTLVTPEQVSSGRIVYHVRDSKSGLTRKVSQDEIFHLRGASDDGVVGKGILQYARENLGIALSTESYASRIFSQGTLRGPVIKVPGPMDKDQTAALQNAYTSSQQDWHKPLILHMGADLTKNDQPSPEDSQMLLSRKFGVDDVARWLGMPRMMLENNDPSFGNAEQFNQNLLTYTMGEWLSLFEYAINSQLILRRDLFFAEFTRDAIERAALEARWTAHIGAVNAGIKTVNEARSKENLRRIPGKADELREPQNITGKPAVPDAKDAPAKAEKPAASPQARAIVVASAARLLRKEITAIEKQALKLARDPDAWAVWVTEFYAKHAALVVETLQVSTEDADTYCANHSALILDDVRAVEGWSRREYAEEVALWALGQEAA